jgi:sulfopyruvate decarboxylase TPP-binding subunit
MTFLQGENVRVTVDFGVAACLFLSGEQTNVIVQDEGLM